MTARLTTTIRKVSLALAFAAITSSHTGVAQKPGSVRKLEQAATA